MPTYEYKCDECGHLFEKFQNMTDEPVDTCPECGSPVRRLLGTGAGVIFKGSGFYVNDYKKSNNNSSTKCGKDQPCCGRSEPCDTSSCHH